MDNDTPPLPFGTALALAQRYLARQFTRTIGRELMETAPVTLTAVGWARFEGVRDALDADGRETFSRLDSERVEAACAVLQQVAELDGDPIPAASRLIARSSSTDLDGWRHPHPTLLEGGGGLCASTTGRSE